MPWAMPPCTWPSTIIGLTDLADVVDGDVLADLGHAGLGVDLDRAQVGAVREGERLPGRWWSRPDSVGSMPSGRSCEVNASNATSWIVLAEPGRALDPERAVVELQVVRVGLEHVRGDQPGLLDHRARRPAGRPCRRRRATGSRRCPCRTATVAVSPWMTSMSSTGDAERVGGDLAPRGRVALPVRRRAGDDLDLAGGQHPDRWRAPSRRRRTSARPASGTARARTSR